MKFKIFTLHPDIFTSFVSNSLIARAIAKQIIEIKTIDWRQDFGIGSYKQVDDKPFGGGSGMVLMADPIINAMISEGCFESEKLKVKSEKLEKSTASDRRSERLSEESYGSIRSGSNMKLPLAKGLAAQADWGYKSDNSIPSDNGDTVVAATDTYHQSLLPNNAKFYKQFKSGDLQTKKVNILMTPRGFPMTQQDVEWLAQDFEEINILCGRYEGFDARINDHIDLELSIGNFVLNGGEVGSMCLVEAVSRLVPDFITKNTSVLHDSFSSGLNNYNEFEFKNSKPQYQRELEKSKNSENLKMKNENPIIRHLEQSERSHASIGKSPNSKFPLSRGWQPKVDGGSVSENSLGNQPNLFNNTHWLQNILPHIEHPQYTRPNIWQDPIAIEQKKVPEVLLSGDHAKIQKWRVKWW
jgi:tRNA G37 N-methylase TrmD